MIRRAFISGLLSSVSTLAWARPPWRGGIGTGAGAITITGAVVTPTSFVAGDPDGTVVGAVSVSISGGSFTGTLALSGTDASGFRLSSTTLPSNILLNGTGGTGPFAVNIVPTQGGAINSGTAYPQVITGAAPGAGTTVTFVNTSGSASPAATPIKCRQWFVRAAVSSSQIAVPQIGGVDAVYNADDRVYWDDGSLMGATFSISTTSFTGSASKAITFDVRSGSYSNTSAITTATVTGETDFKLVMANTHTAFMNMSSAYNVAAAVTMAAGAITGGTVFYPPSWTTPNSTLTAGINPTDLTVTVASVTGFTANSYYGIGSEVILVSAVVSATKTLTFTRAKLGTSAASHSSSDVIRLLWDIKQGGGTNASVYSSAGTITVFTAGSGYANVGSGSFTNSFNTGITLVNGSGNHVGAYLMQYAKGPACDAWRLRLPTPSLPHHHVTWYVERWKKTDGTLLGYYAYGVVGNGLNDTGNPGYCLTYDADFKNGSTVYAGTTNGTLGWTNQIHYWAASWGTFDTLARPFWSASDTAFKAIVQQRTPAECDELKDTGVVAWLNLTPTITVPTTPSAYENSQNGGRAFLCTFQPLGTSGCRAPTGSGGSGNTENPMGSEINAAHWQSLRTGTAGASTWMQNSRVGAAHALGSCQMGGSLFDPTNLYYPCVVPSATQTFTGMTQSATVYSASLTESGMVHPIIDAKGATLVSGCYTYHQTCYQVYPYIVEGERWMLDAMSDAAGICLFATNPISHRQATVGATTYYGIDADNAGNVRVQAWWKRTMGYAARFAPATLSDGTTDIEQSYLQYTLKSHFDYLNALVAYVGATVKFGTGGATHAKGNDFTGSGVWPEAFFAQSAGSQEITVPFMDDYEMMILAIMGFLWRGTATGTSIATFRDYFKIYYVKLWAYSGAHYLNDSYRINQLAARPPAAPSDTAWDSMGNETTPKLGIYTGSLMSFTATNSTIGLNAILIFQGANRIATGSRVKLTDTAVAGYGTTTGSLPPEIDPTVWYYYKELTSTTCELYTDAGLTTKITPSTTIAGKYFWIVPSNSIPADNSGLGTYNGTTSLGGSSRIAVKLGTMRLCQAMGMTDDANGNVTDAITNCALIFNSLPGQTGYNSSPQYSWDSAL